MNSDNVQELIDRAYNAGYGDGYHDAGMNAADIATSAVRSIMELEPPSA